MNAVVDFCKLTKPRAEFKRNVLVGVSSAVATYFRLQTDCVCALNEFFYTDFKTVQARLTFNCGEFAIIKIRAVDLFPNADVFKRVLVSELVSNENLLSTLKMLNFPHSERLFFKTI